jgi:large subunit ribosomal protein L1
VGKLSFDDGKLAENANAVMQAVVRARPAAAKGKYVRSIYLASTMGPSVALDPATVESTAA